MQDRNFGMFSGQRSTLGNGLGGETGIALASVLFSEIGSLSSLNVTLNTGHCNEKSEEACPFRLSVDSSHALRMNYAKP